MTFCEMIAARGLTVREAQKLSGISPETFGVLLDGGQTIPQLALKVGRNLHLTQEEVKQLGKPLNRADWKRLELPVPPPIDGDPKWYEQVDKLPKKKMNKKAEDVNRGRIRRIVVDAAAVKRAMDAEGMTVMDLQRVLWPAAEQKDRSSRWCILKDKLKGGVGMKPDTVQRLAEAIGKTVEEIGVETWVASKRWAKSEEK